jgi:hypothetical protein
VRERERERERENEEAGLDDDFEAYDVRESIAKLKKSSALGDERRSMRAFSYVQVDLSDDD